MCPCVPNLFHCYFALHSSLPMCVKIYIYRNELKCGNYSSSLFALLYRAMRVCTCKSMCGRQCMSYAHNECCHRVQYITCACAKETSIWAFQMLSGVYFDDEHIESLARNNNQPRDNWKLAFATINDRVWWMALRQFCTNTYEHAYKCEYNLDSSFAAAKSSCCRALAHSIWVWWNSKFMFSLNSIR